MSFKPWTSIIVFNEEYFLAQQMKDRRVALAITKLRARKTQEDEYPQALAGVKPWERYKQTCDKNLVINYDQKYPDHNGFDFQEQAERDQKRGLKSVMIDFIQFEVDLAPLAKIAPRFEKFKNKAPFKVDYKLHRIPLKSETLTYVQKMLESYRRKYNLYKDNRLWARFHEHPSCLMLKNVGIYGKGITQPKLTKYIQGITETSRDFMTGVRARTNGISELFYKALKGSQNYVLDGLVERDAIKL